MGAHQRAFRTPNFAIYLILLGLFLFVFFHLLSEKAHATNPQVINFQGKVTNADGTNVANGNYDFDFILYDDPSAGTNRWQETWNSGTSQVTVTDGIFQVALGTHTALPNFNTYPNLYLAIKFNNDAAGYMTPRVRLTSAPYALNSDALGGMTANNFVQLAQGIQTDASTTNSSIGVNKTGGTANILQLQKSGNDVLVVNNSGQVLIGATGAGGVNGQLTFNSATAGNFSVTLAVSSSQAASYTLKLPTAAPGTSECLQTSSGDATQLVFSACSSGGASSLDDAYNQAATTGNTITLTSAGGGVVIQDAATTISSNLFSVQENSANGGANLFAVTTTGLLVQNLSSEATLTLDTTAATPHLKVHGDDPLEYVDIYYDSAANVAYFSASSGTATIGSGTGSVNIAAGSGAAVTITGNAASSLSTTAGDLTLQGGSGTVTLGTSTVLTAGGAITLKPGSSSATAFQLQSSGNVSYLTLDSTNTRLQTGSSTTDATAVLFVLDSYNTADTALTGVNGAMYYNTSTNKFRCRENNAWVNCITTAPTIKSGSVSVTEGTAQTVNFTTAFGSTPQCSATSSSSGYAFVTAVSTSSVTVDWNNATGGGAATATIYWVCTTAGNT